MNRPAQEAVDADADTEEDDGPPEVLSVPRRGRGRRPKDLVERMRASCWAYQIRRESKKSWYELDRELLGSHEDPDGLRGSRTAPKGRALDRIARYGDSPERMWGGVNMVKRGAELAPRAAANYFSPLWKILGSRTLPGDPDLQDLADGLMGAMGFMQLDTATAEMDAIICGPGYPSVPGDIDQIARGARLLREHGTLNAILILSIQARLAVRRLSLLEGHYYIESLRESTAKYDQEFEVGELSGLLLTACLDRIVRGVWKDYDLINWPHAKVVSRELLAHYDAEPALLQRERFETGPLAPRVQDRRPGAPIMRRDQRMLDYQAHRGAILQDIKRFAEDANSGSEPLDSEHYPALVIASQHWNQDCLPFEFFASTEDGMVRVAAQAHELRPYSHKIVRISPWGERSVTHALP